MKAPSRSHKPKGMTEIGWREHVGLPEFHIGQIKAKIDTGARTSAIHALDLKMFEQHGAAFVAFSVPGSPNRELVRCSAPLIDQRAIKNTSGVPETRHIVHTTLVIARRHWKIEISLTDRTEMGFDLILGRAAIRRHSFLVNPGRSFLAGTPHILPARAPPSLDEGLARTLQRGSRLSK